MKQKWSLDVYSKRLFNQSRLNKNVSYNKIPGHKRKDIRDAWIRAIARPVLPKAIHGSSDRFNKDSFDESQELKWHLLGGNLQYILKPDTVPSLFPNGKVVNKSLSSNIKKTIKLRKVKVSLFNKVWKKCKKEAFHTAILKLITYITSFHLLCFYSKL